MGSILGTLILGNYHMSYSLNSLKGFFEGIIYVSPPLPSPQPPAMVHDVHDIEYDNQPTPPHPGGPVVLWSGFGGCGLGLVV